MTKDRNSTRSDPRAASRPVARCTRTVNQRTQRVQPLDLAVNKRHVKAVDFATGGRSDFIAAVDKDFSVRNETFSPDSNACPL
jgi:hypothetical protein